jgi:hypothetical protein
MMSQKSNHHSVRRIVLPSGRTIDVVRFHHERNDTEVGLHMCQECGSELVQPVTWIEVENRGWELMLWCPNCEWIDEGVYSQAQIEKLEEKLDEGVEAILRDLKRLTHANMADQVDRFIRALRADLILPEDF